MSCEKHAQRRLPLKRRLQIYVWILVALTLSYYVGQRWTAHLRETLPTRRMTACRRAATIKIALIFPETLRHQFLQGAELALALRNAETERINTSVLDGTTNGPLRKRMKWKFVPELDEAEAKTAIALSRDPHLFAVVGYYFSHNASRDSVIFEEANLLTMIASANSLRLTNHDFATLFATAPTTAGMASKILPAVSRAVQRAVTQNHTPIRLAIVRTPTIYAEDLCTSLLADLSVKRSLYQFCATYAEELETSPSSGDLTLNDLTKQEKISHHTRELIEQQFRCCLTGCAEFADVPHPQQLELPTKWKEAPPRQIPLTVLLPAISKHALNIEIVTDVVHKDDPHSALKVVTHLGASRPDAVFFAADPSPVNLALIREIRQFGGVRPIIVPTAFDNPSIIDEAKAFLGELYVISHYDAQTQGKALQQLATSAQGEIPDRYLEEFAPSLLAMEGYQAASVLIQAIDRFPRRFPDAIQPVLRYGAPAGWAGLHNPLVFEQNGSIKDPAFFLKRHVNGRLVKTQQ